MIYTFAVVPTKNRHEMVRRLLRTLSGQVMGAVVVDNNDVCDPIDPSDVGIRNIIMRHHPGYPPNISELLNVGIDALDTEHAPPEWNVALLNDDVTCPPNWVETVAGAMRSSSAVMAYTDRLERPGPILFTTQPLNPYDAATVCACIMRGEAHMRFDETMRWWYSDTDMDFRCRREGGVLAVQGESPVHHHPSAQTVADPNLTAQTNIDRETFGRKWNGVPW